MASDLSLLKSFVNGQGAGAQTYVTYAEDHDSNYTQIETQFNALNTEFKALGGNDSVLVLDLILEDGAATGIVGLESFASLAFITGDTQITVPQGTAYTAAQGRVRSNLSSTTLTGSGGSGTRWVALNADGTVTLETSAAQGIIDLYSVTWDGAQFTTATLSRLETVLVDADDFQDSRVQEEFGQGTDAVAPAFTYDTISQRLDDIVRIMGGDLTSGATSTPGGPAAPTLKGMAFAGTAALPGLTSGDGTTYDAASGLFTNPGSDEIGLSTNGIEAMFWDSNQNVSADSQYRFHVTTTAESIADGTSYNPVSMDAEVTDVGGWGAAPTGTWTVPTGGGGFYWISASLTFDESTSGGSQNTGTVRDIAIEVNGTVALRGKEERPPRGSGAVDNSLCVSMGVEIAAGQTIELHARQDSGGTMDADATLQAVRLW